MSASGYSHGASTSIAFTHVILVFAVLHVFHISRRRSILLLLFLKHPFSATNCKDSEFQNVSTRFRFKQFCHPKCIKPRALLLVNSDLNRRISDTNDYRREKGEGRRERREEREREREIDR